MQFRRALDTYWAGWRHRGVDRSAASALAVFRLASWLLCSGAYLLDPRPLGAPGFKIAVVAVLLTAALIAIGLLDRAAGDTNQVAGLALVEALTLPAVLLPTGGLASPFVWYTLNPLLIAAVYLPMWWTWGVLVAFVAAALSSAAVSPLHRDRVWQDNMQVILILVLVTLTTRVQAGLLRRLAEQSSQISQQSEALHEAYEELSVRGEALAALMEYQREAVNCATHARLYRTLVVTARRRFEPAWAGVLFVTNSAEPDAWECPWLSDDTACQLIESGRLEAPPGSSSEGRAVPGPFAWEQAWRQAQEETRKGKRGIIECGPDGWYAAPLLVENDQVTGLLGLSGLDPKRRTELQVWLEYTRTLASRISAAERMRHTLDYLGDVYQFVEGAGISHQSQDLLELVTLYAKQLTRADKAAYWAADSDAPEVLRPVPTIIRGRREGILAEEFSAQVADWWASPDDSLARLDSYFDGHATWYACYTVVRSSERRFGVLFVLSPRPFNLDIDVVRTMGFLGYLAGAMLERQRAEDLHGRLLVAEEQGRIAADIHDSVSQSLFSLVYGLQGAMGTLDQGKTDETHRTLQTLRDVAASVSREIRASIYQLSSAEGQGAFIRAIASFLSDLGDLYGMRTNLTVTGSEDNLSPAMRRAVYRIVREASGNAARHGRGSEILVHMSLTPLQTVIEVRDDGQGFSPPVMAAPAQRPATGSRRGLGLLNMQQLAKSFSGALEITSSPGQGTRLVVRIPDHVTDREEGGALEAVTRR